MILMQDYLTFKYLIAPNAFYDPASNEVGLGNAQNKAKVQRECRRFKNALILYVLNKTTVLNTYQPT